MFTGSLIVRIGPKPDSDENQIRSRRQSSKTSSFRTSDSSWTDP